MNNKLKVYLLAISIAAPSILIGQDDSDEVFELIRFQYHQEVITVTGQLVVYREID